MGRIKVLSDRAINQIAAGEVVENAASVVKELVENSLDAGATEVEVKIKAGGRQLIRVADNGSGMSRDDAVLSFERHATSKIFDADELAGVRTMGFRGEAVPSIAAVSKTNLLTATEDGAGTQVSVDGGKMLKVGEAARARGTTIEVRQLFYNVPVRQQFQKSVAHDVGEVNRVMTLIAMANPEIRFRLYNNETLVFGTLQREGFRARVAALLGEEIAGGMEEVEFEDGGAAVRGMIGKASLSRPTRKGQYLFINGRPVVSKFVSDVVRDTYSTRLAQGRHPVFVLRLELPGECVDVNVHPQKREVRLRREDEIRRLLERAVTRALVGEQVLYKAPPPPPPLRMRERQEVYAIELPEEPEEEPEPVLVELPVQIIGVLEGYILVDQATLSTENVKRLDIEGRGLLLVDVCKANARVLYEQMQRQLKVEERSSQALLVPETIELLPAEAGMLSSHLDDLNRLGLEMRPFGGSTFVVDAVPASVEASDLGRLVGDLLGYLKEDGEVALAASRAAAKKTRVVHGGAAVALLRALWKCEVIDRCPCGRPITLSMGIEELAKRFR
jgi:DNA mismatch repair protein MutL